MIASTTIPAPGSKEVPRSGLGQSSPGIRGGLHCPSIDRVVLCVCDVEGIRSISELCRSCASSGYDGILGYCRAARRWDTSYREHNPDVAYRPDCGGGRRRSVFVGV